MVAVALFPLGVLAVTVMVAPLEQFLGLETTLIAPVFSLIVIQLVSLNE